MADADAAVMVETTTGKEMLGGEIRDLEKRLLEKIEASDKFDAAQLKAQGDLFNSKFAAADKAVDKALGDLEERLRGVNEFRAQMGDQQRTLMPRSEAEKENVALRERLDALRADLNRVIDRNSGQQALWGYLFGAAGLAIAALAHFLK